MWGARNGFPLSRTRVAVLAAMALLRIREQIILLDEWQEVLNEIEATDADFRDGIEARGLDRPWAVANLIETDPDLPPPTPGRDESAEELQERTDTAIRNEWVEVLTRFKLLEGVSGEAHTVRVDLAVRLQKAALEVEEIMIRRSVKVPDLEIAIQVARRESLLKRQREDDELTRLQADAKLRRPRDWKGKTYRREDKAFSPDEQKEAESKELARWRKAFLQAILEADLPLAEDIRLAPHGVDDPSVRRACAGHRWSTLKKRVLDLRPLTRFLKAQGHGSFPRHEQDVLAYFGVRQTEKAARGVYATTLSALRFFEEGGEVPRDARLCASQALANAAAEAAAQRAREAEADGDLLESHQAPPLPLSLLAHLERVVLDTERRPYERAFAWYRLLRHWGALRFDDTLGFSPQALRRRARGILAILRRSKTSGADKGRQSLPAFVSQHGWVERPWLRAGLEIWEGDESQGNFGYKRDFFLPLPTKDLQGVCGKKARYSDAAGFSRALLGSLRAPDGSALLLPEALSFWTEHSDRSGVDSWAAALSVPGDLRGFLGRWGAQGAQDSYVRSATRVQENVQNFCARHARLAFAGGPDFFGEEHLLETLRLHLLGRGVSDEEASAQLDRLKTADYNRETAPLAQLDATGAAKEFPGTAGLLPSLEDDAEDEWTMLPEAPAAPSASSEEAADSPAPAAPLPEMEVEPEISVNELLEAVSQQRRDNDPRPRGFCVAHTRGGRMRRLHFTRACRLVPGEHYKVFVDFGEVHPADWEYDDVCTRCLGSTRGVVVQATDIEEGEGDYSGSESTSSSSS